MGLARRTNRPVGGESASPGEARLVLTLFVTDSTPSSNRARRELRTWMSTSGAEGVSLEIVDVLQHPELAEAENVLATPP